MARFRIESIALVLGLAAGGSLGSHATASLCVCATPRCISSTRCWLSSRMRLVPLLHQLLRKHRSTHGSQNRRDFHYLM